MLLACLSGLFLLSGLDASAPEAQGGAVGGTRVRTSTEQELVLVSAKSRTASAVDEMSQAPAKPPAALHPNSNSLPTQDKRFATKGLYDDEHDSGNDLQHLSVVHKADAIHYGSVVNHSVIQWFQDSTSVSAAFESSFERADADKSSKRCYYWLTNFCVVQGQLVLFSKTAKPKDMGHFRLCNELRGKINLRYSLERPPADLSKLPAPLQPESQPAHITACWQYYGFHLFQCLAAAFAVQAELRWSNVRMWLYNHAQSFPAAAREHYSHAMFLGNVGDWMKSDPGVDIKNSGGNILPSTYWEMWSQNTVKPSDVSELRKFAFPEGKSMCFRRGAVGEYNHHGLPVAARRGHVIRLREVLDAAVNTTATRVLCSPFADSSEVCSRKVAPRCLRVVVVQRKRASARLQGIRGITNLDEVVSTISSFVFTGSEIPLFDVAVVDWATLPVREQAQVAANTDILVAMHGAGNTWLALQPPRSTIIEIWPDCLARNVYLGLAKQYNVRYYALCHHKKESNFMHSSVNVDLSRLKEKLDVAARYLLKARCGVQC